MGHSKRRVSSALTSTLIVALGLFFASVPLAQDDDLSEVLTEAFSLNTVVVIECPIDYSVNYDAFSKELGNKIREV